MNADIKAKWVAALRSGEYQQAQGTLRDVDAFCCLGVLCDITKMGEWLRNESAENWVGYLVAGDREQDLPPDAVCDLVGFRADEWLTHRIPKVCIGGDNLSLYDHNDQGRTFTEIADAIEEQL